MGLVMAASRRPVLTPQHVAEEGLILRAVVGSTVHGLNLAGTDDRDEMGVCIEPPELVVGLQHFEQYIQRDQPEGVPSQPGDLDLVVYSLRKYVKLAAAGNPTVLLLLFAEPLVITDAGKRLQEAAPLFASRQAGMRFLGYLKAQRERMLGMRGQMRATRTELIEQHGYDTKYAMHMLRLGFQGVEYLTTGRLSLPLPEPARTICFDTRLGKSNLAEVIARTEELEEQIKELIAGVTATSPLPRGPNQKAIDRLLVDLYLEAWERG